MVKAAALTTTPSTVSVAAPAALAPTSIVVDSASTTLGEKESLAPVVASDENQKESTTVNTAAVKKANKMAALAKLKANKMLEAIVSDYDDSDSHESNINQPPGGNKIPQVLVGDEPCVDRFSFDEPFSIFIRFVPSNQWNEGDHLALPSVIFPDNGEQRKKQVKDDFDWCCPSV